MTVWDAMEGEYPRTISLFRTSYSFVAQARSGVHNVLTRVWMSQYAPDASSYIPLYVATETLPSSLIKGTMHKYDSGTFLLAHLLTHHDTLTHLCQLRIGGIVASLEITRADFTPLLFN